MNIKLWESEKWNPVLITQIWESTYYWWVGLKILNNIQAPEQMLREAKTILIATDRVYNEKKTKEKL